MTGIELPEPASREELYLDAIAENGGGGGGTSYTAGEGINITDDTISVDTTTVQEKLTAGTGIDITDNTISATGGGGDAVYSTKTTSNYNSGGAVYIGDIDASQNVIPDPTTTDYHFKYFWALPGLPNMVPNDKTINILGTNAGSNYAIAIGEQSNVIPGKDYGVALGYAANVRGAGSVALGGNAYVNNNINNSVALGFNAIPSRSGEVNIGAGNTTYGYSSTKYRVLGGVHDPVDAHDAATKGYVDANAGGSAIFYMSSTPFPAQGASGVSLYSDAGLTTAVPASTFVQALRNCKSVFIVYKSGSTDYDYITSAQIVYSDVPNADTAEAYDEVMPLATYFDSNGTYFRIQSVTGDPTDTASFDISH